MKDFEIDGDDSSDEEEIEGIVEKYDTKIQHTQFLQAQKPEYIQESDPEGYSFLAYALGVKQLYSSNLNTLYYEKKVALGETGLNVKNEKLEEWFSKTLHRTFLLVFKLTKQEDLTKKIADNFINQYSDVIKSESKSWVENYLRYFLKQNHAKKILPQIENCLISLHKITNAFIDTLTLEENSLAPSPFFIFDNFDLTTRDYMKRFFQRTGLIRNNDKFALANNWPRVIPQNSIERLMVDEARKYNGHQNINSVKTASVKLVLIELLENELRQDENSIIEKVEEKYRLKINVTEQGIQDSPIDFLFNNKNMEIYLPYNIEKLKNELRRKFNKDFQSTFVKELKLMQKQLKIKLRRAITPQQYNFVSKDADDFQVNLRLSMRFQRRRIRQAKDDEEREQITGESFQTAWQFGEQKYFALETQEISTKGARNDQVINLETYARINTILSGLREEINQHLEGHLKLNDSLIARWIRDIAIQGKPVATRAVIGQIETSFENIPERFQKNLLKFLVNFSYLLLGCEVQRNPASLIIHQMALDLIDAEELTWTQAISDGANEKNFGGGAIPMSMGGYKKDDDKKATAHPVSCARVLHEWYGDFAVKPWRYDGDSSTEIPNNTVLVKRENLLVTRWLTLKDLRDKPLEEKITAIEQAIITRWYPPRVK